MTSDITSRNTTNKTVREDMEIQPDGIRVPRFFDESPPSLLLGLGASVLLSLRRVSGVARVLEFRRVFAESPAWVVGLGSAESSRGSSRVPSFSDRTLFSRTCREWQPARTSIVFFGA